MKIRPGGRDVVSSGRGLSAVVAVVAVMGLPLHVGAQISETILTVEALNESGHSSCCYSLDDGQWDPNSGTLTWSLPGQLDFFDDVSGEWVASLLNADLTVQVTEAFQVDLNVGVYAGPSDTTFCIASPLISFESIPAGPAQGRAAASFTVTHLAGDYALLMGEGSPGTGAFRSYYNGYLSEGTRFTHLVGAVYVDSGGTATASQVDPSNGFRNIGEDVYDISTEIAFTLTANDLAFVTSSSGTEAEECLGDVDGNGRVNADDLSDLLGAYGTAAGEPGYDPAADLDGNGAVDLGDLSLLLGFYGVICW